MDSGLRRNDGVRGVRRKSRRSKRRRWVPAFAGTTILFRFRSFLFRFRSFLALAASSAAGTAALCFSPGPLQVAASRRRKSPKGRAQDAREFADSTWTYCRRTPEPARGVDGHGCPSTATSRVHFFGYFLCASKESDSTARDGGRSPTGTNARSVRSAERQSQNGFRPPPE